MHMHYIYSIYYLIKLIKPGILKLCYYLPRYEDKSPYNYINNLLKCAFNIVQL